MSRVFKFRAWDKTDKRMVQISSLMHSQGGIDGASVFDRDPYHSVPRGCLEGERLDLMQYTGCIDKNGKEIYEGDIVRDDTTNSIWAVTWNAEAAGWTDKQDNPYSYGLYKSLEKSMEVIGNIYENPEILEEA